MGYSPWGHKGWNLSEATEHALQIMKLEFREVEQVALVTQELVGLEYEPHMSDSKPEFFQKRLPHWNGQKIDFFKKHSFKATFKKYKWFLYFLPRW